MIQFLTGHCWFRPERSFIPGSYLHSLSVQNLLQRDATHVADMLAARPPAVIIPNYRTDWLRKADHDYIREHYVPLADDFWVLGKQLPPEGARLRSFIPDDTRLGPSQRPAFGNRGDEFDWFDDLVGHYQLRRTLDGVPLTGKAVESTVGPHRIETTADCEPTVVWLGPWLERMRPIGDRDHRWLFVNWY